MSNYRNDSRIPSSSLGNRHRPRRTPVRRRRLLFENLEERTVLSSLAALSSGDLLVTSDVTSQNLRFSSSGTDLVVTDSTGITAGAGVTQVNSTTVRAPLAAITGTLDVTGSAGIDTAAFAALDLGVAKIKTRDIETVSVEANASVTASGGWDIEADSFTANSAVTISTRQIAAGDPATAASTGDSGKISVAAHNITIQGGSRLLAQVEEGSLLQPGKIALKVDNSTVALPFIPQVSLTEIALTIGGAGGETVIRGGEIELEGSLANDITSPKRVIGYTDQTVNISLENASLEGESVSVVAESEDKSLLEDLPEWLTANFIEPFGEFLVDKFLPKTPISAMIRGAKSTVSVQDSEIQSEGDVTLTASSVVDASTEAVAAYDEILKIAHHFSAGYSQASSTARTTIGGESLIQAGGDVTVTTDAQTTAVVTARTTSNINLEAPASARDVVVSFAVTNSNSTSQVTVGEDAAIVAVGNVAIQSQGTITNNAAADATTYIDGAGGLSVSLAFDNSDIQSTVNGRIQAGGSDVTRDVVLADISGSRMTIPLHGFQDGDVIRYLARDPADPDQPQDPIGGLLSGEELRVIVVDENTIELARTTGLDLDNTGADPASTQTFSRRDTIVFNPQTAVDPANDQITLPAHGFTIGQQLDYGVGVDQIGDEKVIGEAIGGIVDQTAYFAIPTGADTFRVAATREDALASSPIDLTSRGSGTTHIFAFNETATPFSPSADFDSATDVFTVPGHGFATGDALVYATDSSLAQQTVLSRSAVFDPTNQTSTIDPTGTADLEELVLNISTDTLALVNHGLATGDEVTYQSHDGEVIGGLTDGVQYFVIKVDERYIQLAATASDASHAVAIDLEAGATIVNGPHTLTTVVAPRTIAFDPTSTVPEPVVNTVSDTVLITPFHNYVAGQRVRYQTGGGASIGGLSNNHDYFAIPVTEAAFQLAASRDDALAGIALDLTAGATGSGHRFTTNEVDTISDLILSPAHEIETGERITYRKGAGAAIAPLTDGTDYYAIRLDANTIRLAHTLQDASVGVSIDLLSTGSGTMQGFERDSIVSTFDPTRTAPVVDTSLDTIELPGHGLSTGDEVSYQASGGDAIGGLADNTNYFVIRVDADHIQLAVDPTAAADGTEIPLAAGATLGSGLHAFRVIPEVEIAEFPDRQIDFDPTLVPALDTAASTIRLPNHGLSTAEPVTYLSGGGAPIGGLTNGTQYFVIVVDDNTLQLAAHAGTAIPLSAGATGTRHGLQRSSTITQRDPALRGLTNAGVYFAVVLDANRFQLAAAKQDALAAAPLALDPGQATGTVHELEPIAESSGILVAADLTADNRANAGAGIGGEPSLADLLTKAELQTSLESIKGILKADFVDRFHNPAIHGGGSTTNSLFSGAAGIGLNLFKHTVRANLGTTAEIVSGLDFVQRSTVTQASQVTAQGNVYLGSAKKFASGVAVALGFYTNDVQSIVDGDGTQGAVIDAPGAIDISSEVTYPLLIEPLELLPFSSFFNGTDEYNFIGDLASFLDGSLGLTRIMNVWAASSAYTTKADDLPTVAISGSVGYTQYDNTSQAIVRGGARLNQTVQNDDQQVHVTATTDMELVSVTGIMYLYLNERGLRDAFTDRDAASSFARAGNFFSFFGNKSSTFGMGGSAMVQALDNTTTALIEAGAAVYSGKNGGLEVSSSQDIYSLEFAQSGGDSGSIGISGSIVWVDQVSHTIAQLASGVQITGGPVTVQADDQTTHTSIAGSAQLAKRLGIGVGFALLDIDRTSLALVGKQRTESDLTIGSDGTLLDVASLDLEATSTGHLWSFGLVGALASNIPTGSPAAQQGQAGPVQATSGVALAGDAAWNTIQDTTQAYVNDDGTIRSGDVSLTADDHTSICTVTGAGALGIKPDGTLGGALAGSFSYNRLTLTTEAFLVGVTIAEATAVTLEATSTGDILAISGGLAGALAKTAVTIAGSFSWNEIRNTVRAYADRSTLQQLTDLGLTAADTSTIQADGGAVSVALSRAQQGFGGAVAFGVSAAINNVLPTIEAYLTGATVTNASSVTLDATSDASVTAVTWAGDLAGAASGSKGLELTGAGAGSGNTITANVAATIQGGSDVSTASGGDIQLTVVDTPDIEANAGGVAVSVSLNHGTNVPVALGAAASYNEITGGTNRAGIDASRVNSGGQLVLSAQSQPEIEAQAISLSIGAAMTGGQGAGITFDGAGAGAGNEIGNTTEASITASSTVTTAGTGAIRLTATDTSLITAVAPAVSLSFVTAQTTAFSLLVGISITSNEISNTLTANVDASSVTSGGGLNVQAEAQSTSNSVPVAAVPTLTISQANSISLSGVGAHAFNTITNDVEASLTGGSQVETAGDVNVTASDDSTITANVVAASITVNVGENASGNVAIDAALATNKIGLDSDRNTVRAFIQNSTVTAAGAIDVSATSTPRISGLTVGIGLSISATSGVSFAVNGFGAQTTNSVRQTIEAAMLGTSDVSSIGGGAITVAASESDDPQISAQATGGSLSGSFSGSSFGGAVTIGVVLTDNDVGNQVAAHIDQAAVTTSGDIELDASSTTDIASLTVFVSLSIAIGSTASFAAAGDGANSTNTLHSTIEAYVLDSDTVTTTGGGSVLVSATDQATVNAQAGGGNFSLGIASSFGGSISVATVLATNDIQNTVQAYVQDSTLDAAGDVRIVATSQPEITALTVAVALAGSGTAEGLAAAGAAAASESTNTIANTVRAFITASQVTAGGEIHVSSSSTKPSAAANIHATAPAVSVGISATDPFAGVAFALTGAGGKVTNHTTSQIQAFIDGDSVVAAQGAVEVAAHDTAQVEGTVVAVTVALSEIAGSVAVALVTNTLANDVQGYIGQATVSSAGGAIWVTADSSPTASATTTPVAVAVEASGAGANATSDINGSVAAYVAGPAAVTASSGLVTVQATSTAHTEAEANGGGGSLLLTISALLANASLGQTTTASVSGGAAVNAAGLSVVADASQADALANVLVVNVAGISGAGGRAAAEVTGDVSAFVGSRSGTTPPAIPTNIQLGNGTLTIQATAAATTAHADARGGAGGVLEVSVLVPDAKVTSDTTAYVGEGTTIGAGALTVEADASLTANGTSFVVGIAGLTGDGANNSAQITSDSHTAAFVGPASGTTASGAATTIQLTSGDLRVRSTLAGLATTNTSVDSGAVIAAADGTVVDSQMSGQIDAYLGENVSVTTGGDVTVQSVSASRADATSFGVNVGGVAAALGTQNTVLLNPTLNAFTSAGVNITAADVNVLASHNVDSNGAPLTNQQVQAEGTAGSGSLGLAGAGANVTGTVAPTIDTRLGAGTTVNATGTVTVATNSYQYANVNANSDIGAGLIAVGVTLATGKSQGSLQTHVDGQVISAQAVVVQTSATAKVDALGEANGGGLGAAGMGTNVQAAVGDGNVSSPLLATYVSPSGSISANQNIAVQSLLTTNAAATSSGYAFAGIASVGSLPATATVQPVVRTRIDTGAQVLSSSGNVRVLSGHNYDPQTGEFLSSQEAVVTTNNTTAAIGVSVPDTTITAKAQADIGTILAAGATIRALGGQIAAESRSSNLADAHLTTAGGALVFVGVGDAKGQARGTTSVQVLADIEAVDGSPGASNVSVVTQAADVSSGRITQHGGGGISVNNSHAEADTTPTVSTTIAATLRAANNLSIDTDSFTDADANISNSSGGAIDVTNYHADVTVTPSVSTTVADDAVLAAGNLLSVTTNHGKPISGQSNGTFDAETQVDPATDTISFTDNHGLHTGATVTYDALGNPPLGGVGDGRTYDVVVTGDKTLQLGDAFLAQAATAGNPAGISLVNDTITFSQPHNLQGDGQPGTSDRVVYSVPNGSSVVGGLTAGATYLVNVVNATTIRLVDPGHLPAAPLAFAGTAVGLDQQTITIPNHGFVLGQPVGYLAPAPAVVSSFVVNVDVATDSEGNPTSVTPNPAAHNVYFGPTIMAQQGFLDGDIVIYTAGINPLTLAPAPIGGLVSGGRYAVILNSGKPNEIQLAEVATPDTPIALDTTGVPTSVPQTFLKVVDQPIGGLVHEQNYYVTSVTADTFRLAPTQSDAEHGTNILTLDPTDPVTHAVLTGTRNTLGTRGVHLTSVGAGQQYLIVDITAASSGQQKLLGVGIGQGLANAPSGDGIATASVSGGGGGVVSVEAAETTASSTPTATLTIGQAAGLAASWIKLSASSAGNVGGSADNNNGGFVAVSNGRSSVATNNTASVVVSDGATLDASDKVDITSTTSESANTVTDISSSGFAGIPTANAKAHVDYRATVDIHAATITAENALTISSLSNLAGNVTATANGSGVGSGSSANDDSGEGFYIGSTVALTQTSILGGAQLSAESISVQANVTAVDATVDATAKGGGLGGNSNATARLEMTDTTDVVLHPAARLIGDQVSVSSAHDGVNVTSHSNSRCDCFGGADNSTAKTDYNSQSLINGQAAATLTTSNLTVSADQFVPTYKRNEEHGGGFLVFGSHNKEGSFNAQRQITWDATVELTASSDPQLSVDSNAVIVAEDRVTVTTDTGQPLHLGDTVPAGRTIVVAGIGNGGVGNFVFEANALGSQDGNTPPQGTITGSQGVFEFHRTLGSVELSNASSRDLQIDGITVFPTPAPSQTDITVNVQTDNGFSFAVSNEIKLTSVTIENTHPTAAPLLILNAVIDNPVGSTTIRNASGDIVATGALAIVRTNSLSLTAPLGSIGETAGAVGEPRVNVQLVQSAARPTALVTRAGGDSVLSIQGLLRDDSVADFRPQLDLIAAGNDVDLWLLPGLLQTTADSGPVRTNVGETSRVVNYPPISVPPASAPWPPRVTAVSNHWPPSGPGPTPVIDLGLQGTGTGTIATTYEFLGTFGGGEVQRIQAGHDLTFQGCGAAGCGAATSEVNVFGNVVLTSLTDGVVSGDTNGSIELNEAVAETLNRDLRVGVIASSDRWVTLTTLGAILDGLAGEVANLIAPQATLTAATGIGTPAADGDLNTAIGTLTATNQTSGGIYVRETSGLIIGDTGVRTLGGNGDIQIDVQAGALDVNSVVTADGSGDVSLNTAGLATVAALVSSTTGDLQLTGGTGVTHTADGDLATTLTGTIRVTATENDVTMADGTVYGTGSGTVTVLAAGNVRLGEITTTSSGLNVTATAGAITDSTGAETANLTSSGTATLTAAAGIGTFTADIDTAIGTLVATNHTSGDIYVQETDNLTLSRAIQGTAGDIQIVAGGTLTVGDGNSPTPAVSTAGAGTIVLDANGATSDLVLTRGIQSAAGDITLTADRHVTATAAGDITSTSGNLSVTADANADDSGDLTMTDGTVWNVGDGMLDLNAYGDIALGCVQTDNITATAVTIDSAVGGVLDAGDTDLEIIADSGTVVITAATGIGGAAGSGADRALETAIGTLEATVTGAGSIGIEELNAIILSVVYTTDGPIRIDAGSQITALDVQSAGGAEANDIILATADSGILVALVSAAGSGDVYLNAATAIEESGADTAADILGEALELVATTGIGNLAQLEIRVVNLAALTTRGDIHLQDTADGLTITDVDVDGQGPATSGARITGGSLGDDLTIRASSPLTVNSPVLDHGGGNITLTADDDALTPEPDDLTINAPVTASGGNGTISLSGENIVVNDSGFTPDISAAGSGAITGTASLAVTLHAGVRVQSVSGAVAFVADDLAGNNGAALFMASTATIASTSGTVTLDADGNITLGTVTTGNNTLAAIDIQTTSGAIVDGGASGYYLVAAAVDARITLQAVTGIGSGSPGAPGDINTNTSNLVALNSGATGRINVEEANALNVVQVAQTHGVNADTIYLRTANGSMTLVGSGAGVAAVSHAGSGAGATITLLADGPNTSPRNLILNAPVTSQGGSITLRADTHITGSADGDIASRGGAISIHADYDGGFGGGTIQTNGDVAAGAGNITFSLTDCDGYLNGNIVSGANVVKNGSGALRLNGAANAYTGTTTINGRYLLVNGVLTQASVSIYASNGGVFGGTGTVNATNGLTVYPGAILDPGDVSTTGCAPLAGQLTLNGNLDVRPAAAPLPAGTYRVQLSGLTAGVVGGYDQLVLNGTANLHGAIADGAGGGELLVQPLFVVPVGAEFIIISNDLTELIDTRFNGLPEGAFLSPGGVLMNISYLAGVNDNDVVLNVPGRYDFNGYNGYTADDYTGVSPFQQKTSSNSAGWQTLPPRYFERNYPVNPPYTASEDRLKYDGHSTDRVGSPLTFETTVVAGKAYSVCILTGDTNWNHDRQQFQVFDPYGAGDPGLDPNPLDPRYTQRVDTWGAGALDGSGTKVTWGGGTANTSAGYYRWVCFTTDTIVDSDPIADDGQGTVLMRMRDLGGVDTTAVILAMDIRPVETVGQITLSRTSPSGTPPLSSLPADGATVDTYQGTGAPPGATITITVSAGSPVQYATVTPDGDVTAFGAQVTADATGSFTFSVKRPATLTDTSLATENWMLTVQASSGLSRGSVAQPYEAPQQAAALRFDFGIYGSPVQTYGTPTKSFLEVIPQMLYSATRGYGWNVRVAGANRKDPSMSALRTDLNYARDATFRVDLPDGAYNVRIYHSNPKYYGTVSYTADNFNVYAEGALQYNVPNIPAGTTDIRTFNVTVSGGALELRFQDAGGLDGNFVVAGIDISAGVLPTDQPLLAAGDPRDGGATAITLPLLQPVVAEAAARWAATALTAEQVATLASVQYAVADLGGAYLALANPAANTIRIDDDGAMLGWSVARGHSSLGRGRMTSDKGPMTNDAIDLLTVVMHEMGHLLGYDHSEDADDLMAPVLGAGLAGALATPDEFFPDLSPFSAGLAAAGFESRGQVAWRTGAAVWDFRPARGVDDVFAGVGDGAAVSDEGSDFASTLLPADEDVLLAARNAKSSAETAWARVPRRNRMPRFERDLDAWFAELAAEEDGP